MYKTGGQVLGVTTAAATTVTAVSIPATGMDTVVQVAVAAAAGLAVWAGVYMVGSMFGKR
jgi:hypothetical protein